MISDIDYLRSENDKLIYDRDQLIKMLDEANEIIDSIKKGNIDAIFVATNETAKILVTKVADHTYRTVIENMSEGIVTLHSDGIILYSNSSFAKMVDLPLQEVIGANFIKFIPADYVERFEKFFTEQPDSDSKVELSLIDQKGVRSHFIVSFNRLRLHDYHAINIVVTDITDLKKAEEKLTVLNEHLKTSIDKRRISESKIESLNKVLENNIRTLKEANTELETFAYVASHDLQEPLRKIMTYSSLLIRDYDHTIDQQGQHYINTIRNSSEHMRRLITDILEYSGLSHKYLFAPTNIASIVNEVLLNLELVINETRATIIIETELPEIEANATQMRQLFLNLLSNALKFVRAGVLPVISIKHEIVKGNAIPNLAESRLDEKFCIITVKDNGIGFNPVYTHKIFTIFQRLNNSSVYKGTGIGLAICKKVVEQHNGFLTAESKINEGAVFTVTLPLVQVYELNSDPPA